MNSDSGNQHQYRSLVDELNSMIQKQSSSDVDSNKTEELVRDVAVSDASSATGIKEFDDILHGGFPKGAVVLLAGSSGSGKTIFSFKWLFEGISEGESGVYISLTEPLFKIVQNLEKMSFYDREAIEQEKLKIIDLRDTFSGSGYNPKEILEYIEDQVKTTHATRLCIDSITAIAYQYNDKSQIRTFIFELGKVLATLGCTTILISEVATPDKYSVYEVEEFISDAILRFDQVRVKDEFQRQFKLIKVRGKSFSSEAIPMKITSDGIKLFPKMKPKLSHNATTEKISTGNHTIDEMLFGGITKGSTTLAVGATGTGKTLFCMHFLAEGLQKGEHCVYIGFEESREQLLRNAKIFGWDLDAFEKQGLLTIRCVYPNDFLLEEHFEEIRKIIQNNNVSRCAVDSLSAISHVFDEADFSSFSIRLNGYLKSQDVTSIFTASSGSLIGAAQLADYNLSSLTDSILMFRYVEMQGRLESVISVVKMRGSQHCKDLRKYTITEKGIVVGESLSNYEGVMTGVSKKIRELQEEGERLRQIIQEKEQTEAELRKLTSAIEQSPTSIIITDINGAIQYVNPAFTKITGFSPDETMGRTPKILQSGEHTDEFYQDLWNTITSGNVWHGEFRNKKKNGDLYWEQASIAPVKSKDGRITNYVAVKEDITEKKLSEANLRESENRLKTILDKLQVGITIVDAESHKIVEVNTLAASMIGLPKEQIIGTVAHSYSCPSDVGNRADIGQQVDNSKRCMLTADGREVPILKTVIPIQLNGTPHFLESFVDISQLEEAQAALKSSEERFRDISESMGDWIWEIDHEFRYTYVSEKVRNILGYDPSEVLGKTPFDFMSDEEANRVKESLGPIFAQYHPISDFRTWNIRKDGKTVCLLTSGKPVFDSNGVFKGYRGVDKDITEWIEAENKLKESERKFRGIFESLQNIYYRTTIEGTIQIISPSVFDIVGYTPEELIGKLATDIYYNPEDRNTLLEELKTHGKVQGFELTILRKDGSKADASLNAHLIFDENKNPIAIEGTMTDITALKQKEKELEEAQKIMSLINKQLQVKISEQIEKISKEKEMYKTVLENIPQKIFQKNADFKYVFANENFLGDLDMTLEDVLGKTDWDIFPDDLASKYAQGDQKVMETGQAFTTTESYVQQGRTVTVTTVRAPIKDKDGHLTGVLGIFWETPVGSDLFDNPTGHMEVLDRGENH